MAKTVKFCSPESNLAIAAKFMWEGDCGVVPVVDNFGKVLGMLTDRDICIALTSRNKLASDVSVSEVSSKEVFCCNAEDNVNVALELMKKHKVRRLPVLDTNKKLVGIVSLNDFATRLEEPKGKESVDFTFKDVGLTLKTLCQHATQRFEEPEKRASVTGD